MLKLALQRGLYFEIAYSPLITDATSRRQPMAQAKRAKAAISVNCRTLISKAMRKKHFYKETIRIDRLLPNEQLNSANFKLGDWIDCDLMTCKVDLLSHSVTTEPLGLPPFEKDGEAPSGLAVQLDSNLCRDFMMPQQVTRDEVVPIDRTTISVEYTLYDPETTSRAFLYDEGFNDTTRKIDESTKQNSNGTKSSLNEDVAKIQTTTKLFLCYLVRWRYP
ncbi:hypothetical protein ABZP36_034175 [Zizania latifolia]